MYCASDTDTCGTNGRRSASASFLAALARAAHVELTVFTDGTPPVEVCDVRPVATLPYVLPSLDVLHDLATGYMPQLAELRNHLHARACVTGQLHALATPGHWAFFRDPVFTSRDGVFVASRAYLQAFERVAHGALTPLLAPLGVDATLAPTTGNLRSDLHIPAEAFVVLTLGRFSPLTKQNLGPVRAALELLRAQYPTRRFVHLAAGAPGFEGYECELATWPDTIVFDGRGLSTARKCQLFVTADLFVAPPTNIQESFSLAPVEAMRCGVPVVATAFSGHLDTVPPSAGTLIPVDAALNPPDLRVAALLSAQAYFSLAVQLYALDARKLAQGIAKYLDDATRMQAARAAAIHGATYGWPARLAAFLEHWRCLVAKPVEQGVIPKLDHVHIFAPLCGPSA